jgi:hypothetical protein
MVKTATLNGTKYEIYFCSDADGVCDYREGGKPTISIMAKPNTQKELRVIMHEILHSENWSKSEEIVDRVSDEMSRLVWRLGYRRSLQKGE